MDILLNDEDRYGSNFWYKTLRKGNKVLGKKSIMAKPKEFRNKRKDILNIGITKPQKKINENLRNLKTMFKERPMSAYCIIKNHNAKKTCRCSDGFGTYHCRKYLNQQIAKK